MVCAVSFNVGKQIIQLQFSNCIFLGRESYSVTCWKLLWNNIVLEERLNSLTYPPTVLLNVC